MRKIEKIYDRAVWLSIGVLVFLLFMFSSCSDPMKDIVDGDKAQPEMQKKERGITIDTSK